MIHGCAVAAFAAGAAAFALCGEAFSAPARSHATGGMPRSAPHAPSAQEPGRETASAEATGAEGEGSSQPPGAGDVLADNGLRSPICRERAEVPATVRADCAASGFAGSSAPTGDYAFDVHIDTGLAHFSNYLEAAVQDAAQWGWMALVALVRGVLVMLEWCYSLNLLAAPLLTEVAGALRSAESTLTTPGLAIVMTVASMLAVYHGLVRRRVAQTLGQVLAMVAMMVGGLWAIVDPTGTVGAMSGWVNTASVAALGAVAAGTPEHPARTLAGDVHAVFNDVITSPWCYMEFGNVRWCREPALLDGRLKQTALRIASTERALAASRFPSGSQHASLMSAVSLLDRARDNGDLFLALPANGVARNSINEDSSLLSVLCGGSKNTTQCTGPTAAQAEFRTQHGTWPRVVGLLMIWAGALTMLVLFGWIGLRLLAAAVLSLFLLLLAPAAVLAPALGDGGRGFFRVWATRLLGALTAKLVYSVLLGATLLLTDSLAALSALGWWIQWMLISAAWWLAFQERHHLLGVARVGPASRAPTVSVPGGGAGARPKGALRVARQRALGRVTDAAVLGAGRRAKRAMLPAPLNAQRRAQVAREARGRARAIADKQVLATLEHDRRHAEATVADGPHRQASISARRAQLARVQQAQRAAEERHAAHQDPGGASAELQRRRAMRLAARAQRVEAAIATERDALTAARRTAAEQERAHEHGRRRFSEAQVRDRSRFLDEQAALPDRSRPNERGQRRDYRRLAALAQETEHEFDELSAERRHRAMLRIDDELAMRAGLEGAARGTLQASTSVPRRLRQDQVATRFERAHEREVRRLGHALPRHDRRSGLERWLEEQRGEARRGGPRPTLAERARAAAADAGARDPDAQLQRWRRQFGRDRQEGKDD
jgi:hypothetical protein